MLETSQAMKNLLPLSLAVLCLSLTGCEETTAPSSNLPPVETSDPKKVDVDVNLNPNASPAERREERRENLRDAIDKVDVNVDGGNTKVDVR